MTDDNGRYTAPLLPPGDYEVHVTLTGFQPFGRTGLRLAVGQDTVLDVRLELGTVAEEVTVTGRAPRIDLTSGAVSGLVTDKQIRDLPLNGRSFQQLAPLQVGVDGCARRRQRRGRRPDAENLHQRRAARAEQLSARTVGDPWHDNPSLQNIAPRLGVAWDPVGDGRTTVRGGFGIFH